jgi:type VII secretion-associated serine protease mycosin
MNRWLPALLAVVIAASGLTLSVTRDDGADKRARVPGIVTPGERSASGRARTGRTFLSDPSESPLDPEPLDGPAQAGSRKADPDTIVVNFLDGVSEAEMERAVRAAGATPHTVLPELGTVVASVEPSEREDVVAKLERDETVSSVEPNRLRYVMKDPNDEGYLDQGHLFVSRLPVAWELTQGSAGLDIAILDTGVDLDHPDLNDRIVAGRDVVNDDDAAVDDEGHGTMVAGIAAAETNNTTGVAGVAWNARIMPVKVLAGDGSGTDGDVAEGIVWAAEHGAEVINLSLGGPGSSTLLQNAVTYAIAQGVVVVAAAGNESTSEPSYPAAIPNVVAVGATDYAGEAAPFTNFGPWVDLTAPGVEIVSTAMGAGENYAIGDGTSFSSPIVAGVALLVKAKNPTWTPAQIASKLMSSASDRGPHGIDDTYGRGLLDAYGAVGGRTAASPPRVNDSTYEPNDVPDRAKPVQATGGDVTPLGALTPEGDVDWFYVDVSAAGSITFRLHWGMPSGALNFQPVIAAFTADGRLLDEVLHSTLVGTEELHLPVSAPGRYYFRISNSSPTRGPSYSASVTVSSDPMGFGAAQTHTTGSKPESVAIADVTGDGRNDVLLATGFSNDPSTDYRLHVFPQLADGSLGASTMHETNEGSLVTTGDLDADGDTDVIVGNHRGLDLYHQVDGALVGPTLVGENVAGGYADIADLTGDGVVDIFTQGPSAGNRSAVLTRQGEAWTPSITDLPRVHDPDIRDMTGDGRPDVVGLSSHSPTYGNSVRVLVREQDSTFTFHDYQGTINGYPFWDTGVGEFTGDSRPDVIAGINKVTPTVLNLFAQNAGGSLDAPSERSTRQGPQDVFVTDIDDNGREDIVVLHSADRLGVYRQTAAGQLGDEQLYLTPNGSSYSHDALAVGDVDGDGLADVVIANPEKGLVVLKQTRTVPTAGERLWVRSVSPSDFAKGVAATTRPTATFARVIDQSSVTSTTARLLDGKTGSVVPATVSYDSAARRITLAPTQSLKAGNAYLIDVRNLRDVDGATMAEPLRSRFTVSAPSASLTRADVNGDGYEDLIVGAPTEDLSSKTDAGAVHVMYGSATGVKTSGSQWWTQDTANVPDTAEVGDQFGAVIATGDVNSDGYDDVAVGAPGENVGSIVDAGLVHLFLGSSSGLRASGSQVWTQNSSGIPDNAETSDKFGTALAFGDFDNVAGADLAVSSPGETVDSLSRAGAVHVLSGRSNGLTSSGVLLWTQQNIDGYAAAGNAFGSALAAGDFDGDTHDDLAVGAPFEDITASDQGSVTLMRGTVLGLRPAFGVISEVLTGTPAVAGERFGAALTAEDFGGMGSIDGYDELVIGAPGAASGAGRVDVLFSDWMGLGFAIGSAQQTGNGNTPKAGDGFGNALASARVQASLPAWLAIGAPGEDIGSATDAGVVHLTNPSSWLPSPPSIPAPYSQNTPKVPDDAQIGDRFGSAVRVLDVDRDGAPDLVVGSPTESFGSITSAGAVHVLRRAQSSTSIIPVLITQGKDGVPESAQSGDRFGAALGG